MVFCTCDISQNPRNLIRNLTHQSLCSLTTVIANTIIIHVDNIALLVRNSSDLLVHLLHTPNTLKIWSEIWRSMSLQLSTRQCNHDPCWQHCVVTWEFLRSSCVSIIYLKNIEIWTEIWLLSVFVDSPLVIVTMIHVDNIALLVQNSLDRLVHLKTLEIWSEIWHISFYMVSQLLSTI